MRVVNDTGNAISPLPGNPTQGTNGTFGVTGVIEFNDSAVLTVIQDFERLLILDFYSWISQSYSGFC